MLAVKQCVRSCSGGATSPLRRLLAEASAFGEEAAADELRWSTQPYAARAPAPAAAERAEPARATVLLFPGQGAHRVGMGLRLRDLPAARDLYDLASEVLGWDAWRTCTAGPAEALHARRHACVLLTALAALERVRAERPAALQRARAAAGFSAGELAALVFADALSLEAALRLAELRAAAAPARPAAALAVWLAPAARLPALLAGARAHAAARGVRDPVCDVAAYLHPGCRLLAGDEEALRWVERAGAALGVERAARVRGGGGEHCALGAAAAAAAAALAAGARAPRLAVVCGAEGRAYRGAAHVARGLARAAAAPVRWEQALQALYARPRGAGFPLTLALGPGGAARASLRLVNARAWDRSLQVDV